MKIKSCISKEMHVMYEFSVTWRTGIVFFINKVLNITKTVLSLHGKVLIAEGQGWLL